jgi:hypothetical protein
MNDISTPTPTNNAPVTQQGTPTPTDIWLALLQKIPHPYTTPLPAQTPTALDSTYAKLEPKEGTPVPCRRCPDYLPEGGIWKLSLDKGIFRIFHEATGWRSLGSFSVSGNQIVLFNDPTCFETIGIYEWQLEERQLSLKVIEDTCQVGRRARSFTNFAWVSCQPPQRKQLSPIIGQSHPVVKAENKRELDSGRSYPSLSSPERACCRLSR